MHTNIFAVYTMTSPIKPQGDAMRMRNNNAEYTMRCLLQATTATLAHCRIGSLKLRQAWRLGLFVAGLLIAQACIAASGSTEPIVIGESLPHGSEYFPITYRIEKAAKTYVEYINSIG